MTERHVFYLHGFASSPGSSKAAWLGARLAEAGRLFHCPDVNEPDFRTTTISRMIRQVRAEIDSLPEGQVALIGSSLGAIVALHVAAMAGALRGPAQIDRLVLLAPALGFAADDPFLTPDEVAGWKETGTLEVFHHGFGENRPLDYRFYEDSLQYDPTTLALTLPILILQGLRDQSVDHRVVERWTQIRPNVTLRLLDDDHQLMASLPRIWDEMRAFLEVEA